MTAANEPITIGDVEVRPGERASVSLPMADLYTGAALPMQVHVVCGRRAGPVLFVSAAIHGDELNGVEIIRRLLKRRSLAAIRGTLLAVPVVNVHGFLELSRYLPDRRDLNRSFPGSPKGSIASRMAHIFTTEVVDKADYGIDLHTGAINRANLAQVRANVDDPETLALARAFGAPVILHSPMRENSLRSYAATRGLPVLIYEAGEALRFDELSIRAGLQGVVSVMRHLGMLPPGKAKAGIAPVVAASTSWVRAPISGIVSRKVALGTRVVATQRLAVVGDPLGGEEESIHAPFDGIVICRNNLPLAHAGDALFHIAAFESVARPETRVETFAASLGG
jgi:predicted deacylase